MHMEDLVVILTKSSVERGSTQQYQDLVRIKVVLESTKKV